MSVELAISDLRFGYDSELVLNELDLTVQSGKVCAIVGESGSGKTTLLRCLLQLERPRKGRVSYGGFAEADFESFAEFDFPVADLRRRIGYVPQASVLLPHLSAERNIVLPLVKAHNHPPAAAVLQARKCLETLGIEQLGSRPPWRLSGGQQQRVAIARALAPEPNLLLLDEPTAALDANTSGLVGKAIRNYVRDHGAIALIVTHNLGFARLICDTVALLSQGRIAWHVPSAEVDLESTIAALA